MVYGNYGYNLSVESSRSGGVGKGCGAKMSFIGVSSMFSMKILSGGLHYASSISPRVS
jgi:hypothetical protein